MILGVIPARGGSKGLPGKHIKLLEGKPVIGYTIEAALAAKKLDKVVVSTEDSFIARVAEDFRAQVIKRPADLATDSANIDGALRHAVETVEKSGSKVDIVVWLQANLPIRKDGDIDAVIKKIIDSRADSVISVSAVGWPLEKAYSINKGMIRPYWGKWAKLPRRQDYRDAYISNGAIYAIKRGCLMRKPGKNDGYDYFFGKKRLAYLMEGFFYGIEIDDAQDFMLCEMFLKQPDKACKTL